MESFYTEIVPVINVTELWVLKLNLTLMPLLINVVSAAHENT